MLYIHIPYCKGKCIYCDFYSGGNPDWEKYLKAVASELSVRAAQFRGDCISSFYIGGGTPSLIPERDFENFLVLIKSILSKNNIGYVDDFEFTIEVNPEDVSHNKVLTWKRCGVNRVSMGVQSLVDEELKFLKRRHTAGRVLEAMEILKCEFNNISLDLIYGIPGQNEESLDRSLQGLIDLQPTHISAYSLIYEPHTALTLLRDKGKIAESEEDIYLKLGEMVCSRLEEARYERYEISNYSKPGYRSRHNSGYWMGKPYIGLGPSAASFDGKFTRRTNLADLKKYINFFSSPHKDCNIYAGEIFSEEHLSEKERTEEKIMVELRRKEGIDLNRLDEDSARTVRIKAQRWINCGDLELENGQLYLTKKGLPISDYIILDIIP